MRSKLLLLFLFFLISFNCYSQKIIINGEETSRKLQWADFTGNVDNSSPFCAYTGWKMNFKLSNIQFSRDTAIINGLEVRVELDPQKSWVKLDKATNELLEHEQHHFNCGILCMYEVMKVFKKKQFPLSNLQTGVSDLFNAILKKYRDMSDNYDRETNHGMNKEEQARWNRFFEQQLQRI